MFSAAGWAPQPGTPVPGRRAHRTGCLTETKDLWKPRHPLKGPMCKLLFAGTHTDSSGGTEAWGRGA